MPFGSPNPLSQQAVNRHRAEQIARLGGLLIPLTFHPLRNGRTYRAVKN